MPQSAHLRSTEAPSVHPLTRAGWTLLAIALLLNAAAIGLFMMPEPLLDWSQSLNLYLLQGGLGISALVLLMVGQQADDLRQAAQPARQRLSRKLSRSLYRLRFQLRHRWHKLAAQSAKRPAS